MPATCVLVAMSCQKAAVQLKGAVVACSMDDSPLPLTASYWAKVFAESGSRSRLCTSSVVANSSGVLPSRFCMEHFA